MDRVIERLEYCTRMEEMVDVGERESAHPSIIAG
jgi:hypothetical protein